MIKVPLPEGWTQENSNTYVYKYFTFVLKVKKIDDIFEVTAESEGYGDCTSPGYSTSFEIPAIIIDQLKFPKVYLARDFPIGTKFKKGHFGLELIGYCNTRDQIVVTKDLQGTIYTQNINDLLPFLEEKI